MTWDGINTYVVFVRRQIDCLGVVILLKLISVFLGCDGNWKQGIGSSRLNMLPHFRVLQVLLPRIIRKPCSKVCYFPYEPASIVEQLRHATLNIQQKGHKSNASNSEMVYKSMIIFLMCSQPLSKGILTAWINVYFSHFEQIQNGYW